MTLSEHEQRQLNEIELGLMRGTRPMSYRRSGVPAIAIRLLIAVLVLCIAVVLTFSASGGLTLLIGCGLLATIVGLHRYDANHG